MADESSVELMELAAGDIGVTPSFGGALAEAAAICLANGGHLSGVQIEIVNRGALTSRSLTWLPVTDQMRRCWHDLQEATEYGATGIALLLTKKILRLSAVDRSAKGPGFDYWIGDDSEIPFARKARLEISGIIRGDAQRVRSRITQKLSQTNKSDGSFPAFIVIVEFSRPVSHIVDKDERT